MMNPIPKKKKSTVAIHTDAAASTSIVFPSVEGQKAAPPQSTTAPSKSKKTKKPRGKKKSAPSALQTERTKTAPATENLSVLATASLNTATAGRSTTSAASPRRNDVFDKSSLLSSPITPAHNKRDVPANESISFGLVPPTPTRPSAAVEDVMVKLREAFAANSENLEALSFEIIPNLETLPPIALNFFLSIFGGGNVDPSTFAGEDLIHFLPLYTSLHCASLAHCKMENGTHQLRLRYFAGLGNADNQRERDNPGLVVANGIRSFLTSAFRHPDHADVEACSRRARSLYITARTIVPTGKANAENNVNAGNAEHDATDQNTNETIVACINFALMKGEGFFVNWLATSNQRLDPNIFGKDFCKEVGTDTLQHKHLAVFLLKAANLAVVSQLRLEGATLERYHILLQAPIKGKERAADYYFRVGFEEVGYVELDNELDSEIFPGCLTKVNEGAASNTDYIHFIWNNTDIGVFKNNTGTFGNIKSFSRRFKKFFNEIDENKQEDEFGYPFSAKRYHFHLLSTKCDFFYLPFDEDAVLSDFIEPNAAYTDKKIVIFAAKDRAKLTEKDEWLNDICIDFFIRW
jgi:hypothetical protein